jgi:tetratricopeptide (TPR) repeat protein
MALTAAAINKALFQPREALQLLDRAERLNPRDPRAWIGEWARALAYFVLERYDEAAIWARNSFARNRRSGRALRLLVASYGRLGDQGRAKTALEQLAEIEPGLTVRKVRKVCAHWPDRVWTRTPRVFGSGACQPDPSTSGMSQVGHDEACRTPRWHGASYSVTRQNSRAAEDFCLVPATDVVTEVRRQVSSRKQGTG